MSSVISLSRGRSIDHDPWCLMGILNATPDSFSDGGDHLQPEDAVAAGLAMIEAGASILDVGGESTRPGAERISVSEQISRVVPVITGLRSQSEVVISVDTTRKEVAQAAYHAGADLVNDVSAGLEDDGILDCVAELRMGVILMHRRVPPSEDVYSDQYSAPPAYQDVVEDVSQFLLARVKAAREAGIDSERIILDPGLGFGKSVEQNLELIRGVDRLSALGHTVLVGASRKSFIGAVTQVECPSEREIGSVCMAVEAWRRGASILRVHTPGIHLQGLLAAKAVDHPKSVPPVKI